MTTTAQTGYDVGGVLLERPFKIRRLGHFGFNLLNSEAGRRFYVDLLGFRISDTMDMGRRLPPEEAAKLGDTVGYFTRHNSDHHTFVLFNKRVMDYFATARGQTPPPGLTINQITWQVGSLAEVMRGDEWLRGQGVPIQRTGRDMPGSNWHTYVYDPDGHTNELYYGIEQVGWDGYSKPTSMYGRGFREAPELPQINELDEVKQALAEGIDLHSGYRFQDALPTTYDVDGILMPRPFKVTRIGPVNLFVKDVEAALGFYRDRLGFTLTEETELKGQRCLFLRANTEHHALALFPMALRGALGLGEHSTCASFGLQVASYRQLRDAVRFLRERGCRVEDAVPAELHPGIDYAAWAFDPDGHCLQLYYYMEQIGWDGRPRPAAQRRPVTPGVWPEALPALSDSYEGEPYLGPWA